MFGRKLGERGHAKGFRDEEFRLRFGMAWGTGLAILTCCVSVKVEVVMRSRTPEGLWSEA